MRVTSLNSQANNKTSFGMIIKPGPNYRYIPDDIIQIIAKNKKVIENMKPFDKEILATVTSRNNDHFDLQLQADLPDVNIIHRTVSNEMYTEGRTEIENSLIRVAQEISDEYGKLMEKIKAFSEG